MNQKIKLTGRLVRILYLCNYTDAATAFRRMPTITTKLAVQIKYLCTFTPPGYHLDYVLEGYIECALIEVLKKLRLSLPKPREYPESISIGIHSPEHGELESLKKVIITSIENFVQYYKVPEKSALKLLRDYLIDIDAKDIFVEKSYEEMKEEYENWGLQDGKPVLIDFPDEVK